MKNKKLIKEKKIQILTQKLEEASCKKVVLKEVKSNKIINFSQLKKLVSSETFEIFKAGAANSEIDDVMEANEFLNWFFHEDFFDPQFTDEDGLKAAEEAKKVLEILNSKGIKFIKMPTWSEEDEE